MRMVRLRDETAGLYSHGFHEPRTADSPAVQHRRSRFETLARLPMPPETVDLVRILLASAFPVGATGCQALRPLWADEAMHRAMGFMRLAGAAGRDRTARLDHDVARVWRFSSGNWRPAMNAGCCPAPLSCAMSSPASAHCSVVRPT